MSGGYWRSDGGWRARDACVRPGADRGDRDERRADRRAAAPARALCLARPNARSSHRAPTPQGGGIAVVAAALVGLWLGIAASGVAAGAQLAALTIATL